MFLFCLDIGGTGTRGALLNDAGDVLARADGPPGALSLGVTRAAQSIRAVWRDIGALLGDAAPPTEQINLYAGIAGHSLIGRAEALGQALHEFANRHFVADGYAALLGATQGQPGALISVGTGVAALQLDSHGVCRTSGGWGFPAGDMGGGAWLGLQVMGHYSKHLDALPTDTKMSAMLVAEIAALTGPDFATAVAWQSTAKAGDFGRLARVLVAYADSGDPFSQDILAAAGREIALLAKAMMLQGDETKVHLSGGLSRALVAYCRRALPDIDWVQIDVDSITGLRLLATGAAPPQNIVRAPQFKR